MDGVFFVSFSVGFCAEVVLNRGTFKINYSRCHGLGSWYRG